MTATTSQPGRPERPHVVPKADFVRLAEMAFRTKHTRSLAAQMAEAIGVQEKTAQRWLDADGPPAPYDVVIDTYARADHVAGTIADLLDRTDKAVKSDRSMMPLNTSKA